MIRVYCDSNVYRKLKPTSKQYNQIVFEHFESIRKNAVIVFSEAHLDDLRTSAESYRKEDLELMEKYTGNFFIQYNQMSKKWDCLLATPAEAFDAQNYKLYDQAITNPFDFQSLIAGLGDFPGKEQICKLMETYLDTPLSAFGHVDLPAVVDNSSKIIMDKFVPEHNKNLTIGDLMKNMQPYVSKLLGDWKEMDELRNITTSFVNTDDYKFENWGLAFNEQLEKTLIGKKFTEILRLMTSANSKQDFWLQFQYAYSMLEVFGITEERAGKKRKRNNLTDLTKDCLHAFNAMSCDYFITDDKGLLVKTQILYHIFQVKNTQIVKLDELDQFALSHSSNPSIANLVSDLKTLANLWFEDDRFYCYKIEDEFLHFFDVVAIPRDNNNTYILYSSKEEGRNYMYNEILFVCNKIVTLFNPSNCIDPGISIEDLSKPVHGAYLRVWHFNDASVGLVCDSERASFQLRIELK